MRERLQTLAFWVACLVGACLVGAIPIWLFSIIVVPMDQAVHESHGLIGFIYGMLFSLGVIGGNVALWLITGRGLIDRALD